MYYAAYGSNLHPRRLSARISSAQPVTTCYLPGRSLCFHKRSRDESGKCNILSGGDGVHFAIFEISAKDKVTLDQIEGVGFGYLARTLDFPGIGDCATYVADKSHIDESLQPYDWYKELVLIGARFHEFPSDYLQQIELVAAIRDPDPPRRSKEWRTVASVKASS